jgi:TPP-dependent pyruvate/acetoin dehydrogenase alpha subunit
MRFSNDERLLLYRNMVRGRKFDERLVEMCRKSQVPGMWHSGIGHEAVGAGVGSFLRRDDWIELTHRGYTAGFAKGVDGGRWFAEHLGRSGGFAKGKGGHAVGEKGLGILPGGGTIGSCFPIATGAGIAAKNAGQKQVVVCLFGDGAACRGTLHECMNLAGVWRLPIVWVCENNLYSITTHVSKTLAVEDVAVFGRGYNMAGVTVDGMDVVAVAEAVMEAVERARGGGGPSLIECKTYRFREHGEFDIDTSYRTGEEIERWKRRDPIVRFRKRLMDEGVADGEELNALEVAIEREVEEAASWALKSPFPEAGEAFTDQYAG